MLSTIAHARIYPRACGVHAWLRRTQTHCNHEVLSDWTETPWSQLLSWSWALPLLRLLCSCCTATRLNGGLAECARPNVLGRMFLRPNVAATDSGLQESGRKSAFSVDGSHCLSRPTVCRSPIHRLLSPCALYSAATSATLLTLSCHKHWCFFA